MPSLSMNGVKLLMGRKRTPPNTSGNSAWLSRCANCSAPHRTTLQNGLEGWESNDFAEMVTKDGKATLDLSKDEKLPLPATVEPLLETLLRVMPHARLADVFIEVDDWVGLRSLFTHLNERESAKTRDPRVDVALFAALLAHGLNLPLSIMAEATDIPYHELTHVSDWYVREETLRRAIVALVDYHHSLPLSAAFGPGTAAMSDGIRFEVGARSLHAQYHARYFGPRRGVALHDMISTLIPIFRSSPPICAKLMRHWTPSYIMKPSYPFMRDFIVRC